MKAAELATRKTTFQLWLESFGYARRARDPRSDQRQVYVTLTEAGKEALHAADVAFFQRVQASLNVLSDEERATLARLLHAMSERSLTLYKQKGSDT